MNESSSLLGNPLGGSTGPVIGGRGPLFFQRDVVREPLYVICPLHNPWRWASRPKHIIRALNHFHQAGAVIVLVEIAFNRREFVFANSGLDGTAANCGVLGTDNKFRHKYIGLRSASELWEKEASINVAVQSLPYDWDQVAWIDGDVTFCRPDWVGECIQQLQHYSLLQMFSTARDLSPDYELMPETYPHASGVGYVQAWKNGDILSDVDRLEQAAARLGQELDGAPAKVRADVDHVGRDVKKLAEDLNIYPYPPRVWPGIAWAATRKAWDGLGGLVDVAVWGGADFHMSQALVGHREGLMREDLHSNYKQVIDAWFSRCSTEIRGNVGCMSGTVLHSWHGSKQARGYSAKHALLAKIGFNPISDLKRDSQGLWQLHDNHTSVFPRLRDTLRKIAMERDEDSTYTGINHPLQGH